MLVNNADECNQNDLRPTVMSSFLPRIWSAELYGFADLSKSSQSNNHPASVLLIATSFVQVYHRNVSTNGI